MPRLAAIDLGSNTIKLAIADVKPGSFTVVEERADITRIGEGLDKNGYLLDPAMDRTEAKLKEHVALARSLGAEKIRCVATAGMRGASNAAAFCARVKASLGLEIEIIDGLREAELSFKGPSRAFPGPIVVIDIGGRSTELIFGDANGIEERISLEIGGVRLTERLLPSDPPTPQELEACRVFIASEMKKAPAAKGELTLVGVAGTVMSLAAYARRIPDMGTALPLVEGSSLSKASVEAMFEELAKKKAKDRIFGNAIPEGRHDVIVAGALILLCALERYDVRELRVTNGGVRFGLLFELAGGAGSDF